MPIDSDYQRLLLRNEPIGRAVVTRVWGSAPRPEGAVMLATPSGAIVGSVSGGCVENAVAEEIAQAIARGTPKLVTYGVSDETAWEVGLSCGGTISVFVEPAMRDAVVEAARGEGGSVVATVVSGPGAPGAAWVIRDDGSREPISPPPGVSLEEADASARRLDGVLDALEPHGLAALRAGTSRTVELPLPGGETLGVLLEVFPRQPKLVIFGGVHVAQSLCLLARPLGFRTYVADGRAAWLTRERFPDADELVLGWPGEAFDRIGLDANTYVVLLSHDPKFDDPAMELALRSPAPYVGAIGSRKTQAKRRQRLLSTGFSEAELARVRGPIGLDLGGRTPMETALAILAEIQ
ncbi:MAG TPA: XdhC/CoxI family protein, partial [Gemmatimonadales bacterium]|nr:XdhC/CoxI family protein [Gemmatimonadales bacterium]